MIQRYELYKINVLYYMRHGDSLDTSHKLVCLDMGSSEETAKKYKAQLEKEIGDNFK